MMLFVYVRVFVYVCVCVFLRAHHNDFTWLGDKVDQFLPYVCHRMYR